MKELTIKEKAQRYDEAIEKAKEMIKDMTNVGGVAKVDDIQYLFPELKESEDERIRKWIIENIQETLDVDGFFKGQKTMAKNAISWLEKQGEPVEINPTEFDTRLQALIEKFDSLPKEELIGSLNFWSNVVQNDGTYKDEEKQGEQKPNFCHHEVDLSDCSEEYCKAYYDGWNNCNMQHSQCRSELDDVVKCLINGMKFYYEDNEEATWGTDKWSMPVKHIIEVLEKQCEQEPAGKVEPKFKVGDWVIDNNIKTPFQITGISNEKYDVISIYGNDMAFSFREVEYFYHLWTIQDAKDGDILAYKDEISIYKHDIKNCTKEGTNFGGFVYHCCYDGKRFITDSLYSLTEKDKKDIYPATKEQRDALFAKMKEAGYEWDAEKKGLKKIVVPIFNIGDTIAKKHNSDIHDFGSFTITDITGGKYWYNDRIICDITEQDEWEIYEPVIQKSAWSEEDEEMHRECICVMRASACGFPKEEKFVEQVDNWLKSLKDRVQPKPRQEWSEEDEYHKRQILRILKDNGCSQTLQEKTEKWIEERLKSLRPQSQWKPSDEHYELEEFAKIVRGNLTGISKAVQELFKAKYLQLTGNKMYGGFKD